MRRFFEVWRARARCAGDPARARPRHQRASPRACVRCGLVLACGGGGLDGAAGAFLPGLCQPVWWWRPGSEGRAGGRGRGGRPSFLCADGGPKDPGRPQMPPPGRLRGGFASPNQ